MGLAPQHRLVPEPVEPDAAGRRLAHPLRRVRRAEGRAGVARHGGQPGTAGPPVAAPAVVGVERLLRGMPAAWEATRERVAERGVLGDVADHRQRQQRLRAHAGVGVHLLNPVARRVAARAPGAGVVPAVGDVLEVPVAPGVRRPDAPVVRLGAVAAPAVHGQADLAREDGIGEVHPVDVGTDRVPVRGRVDRQRRPGRRAGSRRRREQRSARQESRHPPHGSGCTRVSGFPLVHRRQRPIVCPQMPPTDGAHDHSRGRVRAGPAVTRAARRGKTILESPE